MSSSRGHVSAFKVFCAAAVAGTVAVAAADGAVAKDAPAKPGFVALAKGERDAVKAVDQGNRWLVPVALDMSRPEHKAYFLAHQKAAGHTPDNNRELADFVAKAEAHHKANGKPKPGFVFLTTNGARVDETGQATASQVGPITNITSFQALPNRSGQLGVSALVSLPDQPSTCTQTLQIFDEQNNPQGPADTTTQQLSCENVQLYTTGALDAGDQYAVAKLLVHGMQQNGTPFVYMVSGAGSVIPTNINSIDPRDKTGDGMIKFCFGRQSPDCDYQPAGSSMTNVFLPINGTATWSSAMVNPKNDPNASVAISITQPQPQQGGGCNLVANVQDFLSNYVTLSADNMTIQWQNFVAQFPAINSACMPNGSIVYYNMSMDVHMATNPPTPTFFGISSSPETPISTGFFQQLPQTRIYWSCLAADSKVAMHDGEDREIADLREGDLVVGGNGVPLKVASVYTGTEEKPMVVVTTENGLTVKLTEGHPVMTSDGVRLARHVTPGMVLKTAKGGSAVTTVSREPYAGKVYNLSLAAADGSRLGDDQDVFFGNGIMVGGNEMQWRHDRRNAEIAATPQTMPKAHMSEAARALISEHYGTAAASR